MRGEEENLLVKSDAKSELKIWRSQFCSRSVSEMLRVMEMMRYDAEGKSADG